MFNLLIDIDQTLVDSRCAKPLRDAKKWSEADKMISSGRIKPYTGMVELIIEASNRGHKICFVSSSSKQYCEKILDKIGLGKFPLIAYQDTNKHKPDPEPYRKVFEKWRNKFNKYQPIVIVGDSVGDIIAANELKMPMIFPIRAMWGVSRTDYSKEKHIQPNTRPYMIAETVQELKDFLFCKWPIRQDEYGNEYCFNFYPHSSGYYDGISTGVFACYKDVDPKIFSLDIYNKTYPRSPLFMEKWGVQFLCELVTKSMNEKGIDDPNKVGLLLVPSSEKGVWCEKLIPMISETCKLTGAKNCAKFLYRHTTKDKAHKGNRSITENVYTMRLTDPKMLKELSMIIVIDNITTTGNTFAACEQVIQRDCKGYSGNILKAALAKTRHVNCGQGVTVDPQPSLRKGLRNPRKPFLIYNFSKINPDNRYHVYVPGLGRCDNIPKSGLKLEFTNSNDIKWYAPIGYAKCEVCQQLEDLMQSYSF